jgi:hypothetical protein
MRGDSPVCRRDQTGNPRPNPEFLFAYQSACPWLPNPPNFAPAAAVVIAVRNGRGEAKLHNGFVRAFIRIGFRAALLHHYNEFDFERVVVCVSEEERRAAGGARN